ncbi:unnamed protein product [Bathycoccus prasinos]
MGKSILRDEYSRPGIGLAGDRAQLLVKHHTSVVSGALSTALEKLGKPRYRSHPLVLITASGLQGDEQPTQNWCPKMSSKRTGNLLWNKRVKAHLILAFSTSTNCESMAYRSFSLSEFDARGVRKVTTGITGLWQPSVHSDVAF